MKYTEIHTWLAAFDDNIQNGTILSTDNAEVIRSVVEKIICKDTHVEMYLKCGICIKQEYVK